VPSGQAHVGQHFALLCRVDKHPIVTFLGRIERSEERSDVSGYDDRRSFRCAGMLVRQNLMKRGG
jgi:hypothetical protein